MIIVPQEISLEIFRERYAQAEESLPQDMYRRIAAALASAEAFPANWLQRFHEALNNGLIMGGRINSAAGTLRDATLLNCFVQPIGDSIESIHQSLREAEETMRRGGGVGYNFSALRPADACSTYSGSSLAGPLSVMELFDRSCRIIESSGHRRGAQMGVLNIEHPDIEAFVQAKQGSKTLCNFNLSVGISDRFMLALMADADWSLVHVAPPDPLTWPNAEQQRDGLWCYRTIRARVLWAKIMRAAYDGAEPGVLFLDTINRDNNLGDGELIQATNPCGEQPLPDYGCCDLASINLTRLVRKPFSAGADFDFSSLARLIPVAVRMLDNVYDVTRWPLPQQRAEALLKRRIGLGFLGLGDALIMLGLRYDSQEARQLASAIAETLRNEAYRASVELAREKGPFPLFDAETLLSGAHSANRLPEDIKGNIRQNGLRNSHLTCVAPTGTTSLALADNASNGIEPAYSWCYRRNRRMPDGSDQVGRVEDFAYRLYRQLGKDVLHLPPAFVSAHEVSALDQMRMVAAVQPYIDAGIAKTVNIPVDYPFGEFEQLYFEAWRSGLKGITVFRPSGKRPAVLFC